MDTITLRHLTPNAFSDVDLSTSQLWAKEISFTKGADYLIAAESGTGKSSLFDFIYMRRSDYAGDILFDSHKLISLSIAQKQQARREQLSIVFQGFRLFPELTAWENVQLKNQLTNHKTDSEVAYYFHQLGLSANRNQPARTLSFGQQQRVAIIRALCQPFDFLLLDEPFSHLDEQNVALARTLIRQEVEAQGAAMLLSSLGNDYGLTYNTTLRL